MITLTFVVASTHHLDTVQRTHSHHGPILRATFARSMMFTPRKQQDLRHFIRTCHLPVSPVVLPDRLLPQETQSRQGRKQPRRAHQSVRQEKREIDNGHDSGKNQKKKKRALVCYDCGGRRHPACAQHLQTTPPKLLTRVMCAGSNGNVDSTVQATKKMSS